MDDQGNNAVFRSFIHEKVNELKKQGRALVFFRYQIDEIEKSFPHDRITALPVNNYYILTLIKGRDNYAETKTN